jgi:transcriptional regulator with XRE-family HTH domain
MDYKLDYKSIGMRIKSKRTAMKLTQEKLSEAAGIGIQHLSKIENGKVSLSLSCLVALANALQTTTDHLLMDGLIAATPNLMKEVEIFFDDCTHDEIYIIMRTAATLRESIRHKK